VTRDVHWFALRRGLLGFADKFFHRPDKHPEPLARGKGDRRWTLLARQPVANDARVAELPVPRHFYNPEEDGAGHQGRADNNVDPAAAERGRPSQAGVAAALGYGPGRSNCPKKCGLRHALPPISANLPRVSPYLCRTRTLRCSRGCWSCAARAHDKLRERLIPPD
jgi:hypothetical protein